MVIWGLRRSGGVPGNLSSGDRLFLPTWTLSLAVGAREDSVMGGAPEPVSGPSGGSASPRKLGARQVWREWDRKSTASRMTHTLLQTSVSLKRIQHFLNQDELDPQCVERKTITPGLDTPPWAALATALLQKILVPSFELFSCDPFSSSSLCPSPFSSSLLSSP